MISNGRFYDVLQGMKTHTEEELRYIFQLMPPQLQKARS